MGIASLDKKISIGMFFSAMGGRLQSVLASTLTPEEKLAQIQKVLEEQVQEKRQLAREIGASMRAIADPETDNLELLEALQARRAKLVKLGGTLVDKPSKKAQLGQVSQEVKALDGQIASQQATYDTLNDSYQLAKANYQQALQALETVRDNGRAMLKAIEAHKQALAMRDKAQSAETVDTSFMSELEDELSQTQAELRSDEDIDNDLDATSGFNVDAALSKLDAENIDDNLMAEFEAAK